MIISTFYSLFKVLSYVKRISFFTCYRYRFQANYWDEKAKAKLFFLAKTQKRFSLKHGVDLHYPRMVYSDYF